ncbi:hypothetical protein PDE_07431 [Penicillium oxalicum 114-2]|uniref:Uncharacterized protein n=1 Tax=Penicillium oxalicum (strain 114-2 / CGMCC 5302) TaxID=933388 RepID=S7ZUP3_PENO1|nr:hypothetical protein PDE_07431 [Penicillium oxalicum 114-2]
MVRGEEIRLPSGNCPALFLTGRSELCMDMKRDLKAKILAQVKRWKCGVKVKKMRGPGIWCTRDFTFTYAEIERATEIASSTLS